MGRTVQFRPTRVDALGAAQQPLNIPESVRSDSYMTSVVHPLPIDRLTELVVQLSGADSTLAATAVADAVERHGDWGDGLLNVADALVTLRREPERATRVPAEAD